MEVCLRLCSVLENITSQRPPAWASCTLSIRAQQGPLLPGEWGVGGRTGASPAKVTAQSVRRYGGDEADPRRSQEGRLLLRVRTKPAADKQIPWWRAEARSPWVRVYLSVKRMSTASAGLSSLRHVWNCCSSTFTRCCMLCSQLEPILSIYLICILK